MKKLALITAILAVTVGSIAHAASIRINPTDMDPKSIHYLGFMNGQYIEHVSVFNASGSNHYVRNTTQSVSAWSNPFYNLQTEMDSINAIISQAVTPDSVVSFTITCANSKSTQIYTLDSKALNSNQIFTISAPDACNAISKK